MKVIQPFRSPGEYACFLSGVTACAQQFGHKVDAVSWGGGIPTELTLVPIEPDVVVETDVNEEEYDGDADAGT